MILGELKGFKESALRQISEIQTDIEVIRAKVDGLNKFRWKLTGIMAAVVFMFEGGFQIARLYVDNTKRAQQYEKVIAEQVVQPPQAPQAQHPKK